MSASLNDSIGCSNSTSKNIGGEDRGGVLVEEYHPMPNREIAGTTDTPESVPVTEPQASQTTKKRKASSLRSEVWKHFKIAEDRQTCKCNYCSIIYKCDTARNGTSCLKQHIARCKQKPRPSGQQTQISFQKNEGGEGDISTWKHDSNAIQNALTRMIVRCELPFKIVDHPAFRDFCATINPRFNVVTRNTARKKILDMYDDEKKKLKKIFEENGSRLSLTTDTWTSNNQHAYLVITAHFIDSDWNVQKKILNFASLSSHRGDAMARLIEHCLKEWDIKKLFTITVDNASANDVMVNYLKRRFSNIVLGNYVHIRCVAHIVNLIVMEGMKESIDSIDRVRAVVKYIKASPARLRKFKECVEMERIQSKSSLRLDVRTRWNSTYLMLEAAQKFELAFERFEGLESDITTELEVDGGTPKQDDWSKVRKLVTFLRYFYDLTLKVSGSKYITSHHFFHDLNCLYYVLEKMKGGQDVQMKSMAEKMKEKCNKYWGGKSEKLNILIFVVVVFDPRYKLQFVTLALKDMYGESIARDLTEKVKSTTLNMFNEYKYEMEQQKTIVNTIPLIEFSSLQPIVDDTEDFGIEAKERLRRLQYEVGGGESLTELDKYLAEAIEDDKSENFNVLAWWKTNCARFPICACIARHLLAIPISTVASESAFSTSGRILDPFRSSLTPKIVEALICVEDWIGGSPFDTNMLEDLAEQEAFEEELAKTKKSQSSEQSTI